MSGKWNSLLFMLFLFLQMRNASGATHTLEVDLSNTIRPVTQCASGSLYGITEDLPADIETMVAPLKPNVFANPAVSGPGHQQPIGDALKVSERLVNTTAKVQVRFADILPGWPYRWPGQSSFLNSCREIILAKIASGRTNYDGYEIWNEPYGTWDDANGDFHSTCWKPTYDLIKSLDPEERIIGPSFAYYNNSRMRDFLTFCKENNCLPDIICWHQWGSGGFVNALESYRQLESSLGISPRAISINEYSSRTSDPYEGCPGYSVPFIAKFERHGVESACISWWHTAYPGRLGSLLTPSNEKGGGWHLYKWYGDMTGRMVDIIPPDDYSDGIDGFGCIDEEKQYASICLGGNNTGTVNVVLRGIPSFFGNEIKAQVEYVPWEDKDSPVSGPVSVSTTVYPVSDGTVTIPVDVTSILYAYRIYITPESINLNLDNIGRGTVTCTPEKQEYDKGEQVVITAHPSVGWVFDRWSGDASGNQNPLTISMNESNAVTAHFLTANGNPDLVQNGTFSSGADSWIFNNWSGEGSGEVQSGEYRLSVDAVGDNYYDIQVVQPGILLEQGKTYRLEYDAYASSDRVLNINVGMPVEPYTTFLTDVISGNSAVDLTTSKESFVLDFVMEEPTYEDSRVEFSVGLETPTVYVDNISLYEISPSTKAYVSGKKVNSKQMAVTQIGSRIRIAMDNPSHNRLFIRMYDLKGSIVKTVTFPKNEGILNANYSFDVSAIPSGYYVVEVRDGASVFRSAIISEEVRGY